jgi:hypothetical protein
MSREVAEPSSKAYYLERDGIAVPAGALQMREYGPERPDAAVPDKLDKHGSLRISLEHPLAQPEAGWDDDLHKRATLLVAQPFTLDHLLEPIPSTNSCTLPPFVLRGWVPSPAHHLDLTPELLRLHEPPDVKLSAAAYAATLQLYGHHVGTSSNTLDSIVSTVNGLPLSVFCELLAVANAYGAATVNCTSPHPAAMALERRYEREVMVHRTATPVDRVARIWAVEYPAELLCRLLQNKLIRPERVQVGQIWSSNNRYVNPYINIHLIPPKGNHTNVGNVCTMNRTAGARFDLFEACNPYEDRRLELAKWDVYRNLRGAPYFKIIPPAALRTKLQADIASGYYSHFDHIAPYKLLKEETQWSDGVFGEICLQLVFPGCMDLRSLKGLQMNCGILDAYITLLQHRVVSASEVARAVLLALCKLNGGVVRDDAHVTEESEHYHPFHFPDWEPVPLKHAGELLKTNQEQLRLLNRDGYLSTALHTASTERNPEPLMLPIATSQEANALRTWLLNGGITTTIFSGTSPDEVSQNIIAAARLARMFDIDGMQALYLRVLLENYQQEISGCPATEVLPKTRQMLERLEDVVRQPIGPFKQFFSGLLWMLSRLEALVAKKG